MSHKTVILLAMHGMPPSNFPGDQMAEWGRLHATLNRLSGAEKTAAEQKYLELDNKIRDWPRTEENDPYHAASHRIAKLLETKTNQTSVVGFNEFDRPDMGQAFDQAVQAGATRVVVITPMMTRGGSHSESDIPLAIEQAKSKHPNITIEYIWPFNENNIAQFLHEQIELHSHTEGQAALRP